MTRERIGDAEKILSNKGFFRSIKCYLVNLQHVKDVSGYTATLSDGSELKISQPRKKGFMEVFQAYLAGREKEY